MRREYVREGNAGFPVVYNEEKRGDYEQKR